MRIWHKALIPVLPQKQLQGQWRELSAIAGTIIKNGTPNHVLVNKIMDYPLSDFYSYSCAIRNEMSRRGYKLSNKIIEKVVDACIIYDKEGFIKHKPISDIYNDWHNNRYLVQSFFNLQEKFDNGGVSVEEWSDLCDVYYELVKEC